MSAGNQCCHQKQKEDLNMWMHFMFPPPPPKKSLFANLLLAQSEVCGKGGDGQKVVNMALPML